MRSLDGRLGQSFDRGLLGTIVITTVQQSARETWFRGFVPSQGPEIKLVLPTQSFSKYTMEADASR